MYFVTVIKEDSQAITRYDDSDAAMSAFHNEMAYAYNAKVPTTCYVTDKYGNFVQRPKVYRLPVSEDVETGVGEAE